jgi:hypothetical protein
MQRFIKWLANKISPEEEPAPRPLRRTNPGIRPKPAKPAPAAQPEDLEFAGELGGKIMDGGPGKNVLVRNKYVREDSGTHETLKIIDDTLVETDDEGGADPYNTGRFDRSKSWDSSRSRK